MFVCAACGLVYELELVALASYLVGDAVTQASVVLSVMVFAMGIGSLLAKHLRCRASVGFGLIEAALALVGGISAMGMYAWFAWAGPSRWALVVFSLAIGVLIGAEMPLLMTLLQRVRAQDAGGAVADLFAADCVGALAGGLAFPFLLLPHYGQLTGALLTGVANTIAGGAVVLWLFGRDLRRRTWWCLLAANALVVAVLAAGCLFAEHFERAARDAVYGSDVRVAIRTDVQEIVLVGGVDGPSEQAPGQPSGGAGRGSRPSAPEPGEAGRTEWPRPPERVPLQLFLNGRLKVNELDEARYHESLVHPAMASGPRSRVLVLGGGDGLAVREVLRYPETREVTVVEIDPGVVRLARSDPALSRLNGHALDDPRVRVETADAFEWLREWRPSKERPAYDVILTDLPDPGISSSTKLYSQEFFGLARRALSPAGRLGVHADAGVRTVRDRSYWTVDATLRSIGLRTTPYLVDGRLSDFTPGPDRSQQYDGPAPDGYWGFLLASGQGAGPPPLRLAEDGPHLRSLDVPALREAARRAQRGRVTGLPPSTLMHPRYLG